MVNQLACNNQIDYSQVLGEKILPYKFTLDLVKSVLNPAQCENQKFCYVVEGVGLDTPEFANLNYFILGICPEITPEQIVNIKVFIDGIEQTVKFGDCGNVKLKSVLNPDKKTGCAGLKFDFKMNKVKGLMNVCFELKKAYPVGPNSVCLWGCNTIAAKGLSICGPVCDKPQFCEAIGYQIANVCVPVTVSPFAHAGDPKTFCCGKAVITPGAKVCPGIVNGSCKFTISQRICVAVPVTFGAVSNVGDTSVLCEDATGKDVCTDCKPCEK